MLLIKIVECVGRVRSWTQWTFINQIVGCQINLWNLGEGQKVPSACKYAWIRDYEWGA